MPDGPEPDIAASASTLSGQSALVSSHPDIQRGNARKYIVFLNELVAAVRAYFCCSTKPCSTRSSSISA